MASLSPVTAGQPVGEARFVRAILLTVRTPSLRRVFRDSDHAECERVVDEACRLNIRLRHFNDFLKCQYKTWTGLPVKESVRKTQDGDKWRKYVHGVANLRIEDGQRTEQGDSDVISLHIYASPVGFHPIL